MIKMLPGLRLIPIKLQWTFFFFFWSGLSTNANYGKLLPVLSLLLALEVVVETETIRK